MKRYLLISLALILCSSAQLRADDIDIYGSSAAMPPNVLIIFDSSGSMTTNDVPDVEYDPNVTYVWAAHPDEYGRDEVYKYTGDGGGCSSSDLAQSCTSLSASFYR